MRFITAAALALSLFGLAPAAEATHGNPVNAVAKQRAAEACADMQHGANRKWALITNLQTGFNVLQEISGGRISQDTAMDMSQQYQDYLREFCPKLSMPEEKEEVKPHESKPSYEAKHL